VTESGGGWYPDPGGEPGRLRWWDGTGWTDRTIASSYEDLASDNRPPRRSWSPRSWSPRGWSPRSRTPLIVAGCSLLAILVVVGLVAANQGARPDSGAAAGRQGGEPNLPTELPTSRPPATVAPCDTGAPPSTAPPSPTAAPPHASAPRVTDTNAGISYAGQGEPWRPWTMIWTTPGLQAEFAKGYFIVTQNDTPDGQYYATVLSGTLTALVGDGPPANPRCVAQQLSEDVRDAYYPRPNERATLDARPVTVGGHSGYLIRYHLTFQVAGYDAKGEQVGIMVLNTGRPKLAVLYISIPDTVHNFDYVFDQVFNSVQTS
jgi:hypothetical protein